VLTSVVSIASTVLTLLALLLSVLVAGLVVNRRWT